MGSSENLGTNSASSTNGGILPLSLLESATLSAALDDNSALTSLQISLRTPSGSDPINTELERLEKSENGTENNNSNQDSTNYTPLSSNIFDSQTQNFINTPLLPTSSNNNSAKTKAKDSLTGNATDNSLVRITQQNLLNTAGLLGIVDNSQQNSSVQTNSSATPTTSQTSIPNFAIRTEGTISINGNGDFDGVPTSLSDDALIYAAKGFIMNGNLTLPVQIDAARNPIRDANGKLVLVDKAVAVASGYTTSIVNGSSNKYAGLTPPPVVPQQTVIVPAYADIKQIELNRRIPVGTPTVTFNISQNPLNSSSDWSKKFPPPGTTNNPTVVRITGGGLNIPANVSLNNYIITVEQGDINFNGNGHNFNNVVLIANNGNVNLSNLLSRDLSVFASGSINMNGGARFAGSSLLATGSANGNITFNGATSSINTTDNLKVFSQGDITYNGATNTRGLFLSVKNFIFNGNSSLYGSISAKGNIIFNGQATVIGVAELMPDINPPIISATLARDTALLGQTNQDFITFDPTITGTVTDANPILEFRAGLNNTLSANYTNVMQGRNNDGSFSFSRSQLETINGGTLNDGVYTLHLQAKDLYGNLSDTFNLTFTLDTTTLDPNNLDLRAIDDSGSSNIDNITNKNTPSITGNAEAGAVVQLLNNGQLLGQAIANNTGVWQIVTSNLTDGTYNLTATATDIAGNVSNLSAPIAIAIDSTLPLLTLNTPVDTVPLTPGARLIGRVDGTGSAVTALSYHFDNLASVPVPFNATGVFDQSLDLTGLSNGSHTLTLSAKDTAGNVKTVQYNVTVVIDQDAPVISATLVEDTAPANTTNTDKITFDPSITGTVTDVNQVVSFQAGFNNTNVANFVNVLPARQSDGSFSFSRPQLEQIYGGTLPDGQHILYLQVTDSYGNTSSIFAVAFTLDTVTPAPTLKLSTASDSGFNNSDRLTNDATPIIVGTAEVGASVELFNNGQQIGQTTVSADGTWQITTSSLTDGIHSLSAAVTDIAGNTNTSVTSLDITVDTVFPQLTLDKPFDQTPLRQGDKITGRINGTGSSVISLSYRFNNQSEIPIVYNSAEAFDQELDLTGLGNGVHVLTIVAIDAAGNLLTTQYNVTVQLDEAAPVITAALTNDTAPSSTTNSDRITFDPAITGNVVDTSRVVEFRAGFDNTPIANFVDVLRQLNSDGTFSFDRSQLAAIYGSSIPDGVHTLHLLAQDEFGNLTEVYNFTFTLDTTTPAPNNLDLPASNDSGTSSTDNITKYPSSGITGNAEAGATVQLVNSNGGQILGQATADANGAWQITTNNLADDTYNVSAIATDIAGNLSSISAITITIDSTAPTLALTTPVDTTPLKQGARLVGSTSGTGSSISALSYSFDNQAAIPLFFNPDGSFDQQLDFTGIANGDRVLTITTTDIAGNITIQQYNLTVNLDYEAPIITANLIRDTAQGGNTNSDRTTFDPTIVGTVTDINHIVELRVGLNDTLAANYVDITAQIQPDSSFTLNRTQLETILGNTLTDGVHTLYLVAKDEFDNISPTFEYTFTLDTSTLTPRNLDLIPNSDLGVTNSDDITNVSNPTITGNAEVGATVQLFHSGQVLGTATADSTGTWQIVTSELTDGIYNLTAVATDIAGNVSNESAPLQVIIDKVIPQLTLGTPVDTAPLAIGANLTGSVNGTGSAVASLRYRFDNLEEINVDFDATGEFEQQLDLTGLNHGTHVLTLIANDIAGNLTTITYNVNVNNDTTTPVIAAVLSNDTAPGGITNSDKITADPAINGTVADISRIVSFKAGFNNTLAANFVDVIAQLNTDGSFSFNRTQLETIYGSSLPDGAHTLRLIASDEFGNTSNAFSFTFTLDTTVTQPVFNLDATSDSGIVGDKKTKFDTVKLTGLTDPGVTVSLEATDTTVIADNTGKFTFTNVSLIAGVNSFTFKATDIAGNQRTYTTTIYRFSAPTAINLTANNIAENSPNGTVIGELSSLDLDTSDSHTYSLVDDAQGRFQIVGNSLQVANNTLINYENQSQHTIVVRSTDAQGLSTTQEITVNVTNVNEAPSFTSTPIITTIESGSTYTYNITTIDPDAADTRIITATGVPSWLIFTDNGDGTAALTGTSNENQLGLFNIAFTVEDAGGLGTTQNIILGSQISLTEETDFTATRSLPLVIPATPSILSFKIDKSFDISDPDAINDAFEVVLVDTNGNSLVHTVAFGRDAFFNWTEGEDVALGAGASYNSNDQTVRLNLTGVKPGHATLIFRLVNNDSDTTTNVSITEFVLQTAPANTQPPLQSGFGTQPSANITTSPNFNNLTDVSQSFSADYHRTSFNADTRLLYADIAIHNIGSYSVDAPMIVAVNHISDPTVVVRNPDGFTPEGIPYYNFSNLVAGGKLDPNESTKQRSLVFYNPQGMQFSYDLVVLAQLNQAPVIQTQPNKEIIGGQFYSYDVNASDPNGDSLTYKLLASPDGMTIDSTTGLISWNTTTSNIGNQIISLEVSDGRGGVTQQNYTLSVIDTPPNRPPLFTSTPVVDAYINQLYKYDANAIDLDEDYPLSYSLILGPNGMTVNPDTGVVEWTPPPVLNLGDTILGRVGIPGEMDEFTFSGMKGQRIYFDPLQYSGDYSQWRFDVYSPSGRKVINGADFRWNQNQLLTLDEYGNYRVVVDAQADRVGTYGFSIIDLGLLPIVLFDTTIPSTLSPGTEDDTFRFIGNKGQKLYFDRLTKGGSMDWVLYNPSNQVVASNSNFDDMEVELPGDGEYILTLRGNSAFTSIVDYSFTIITSDINTASLTLGSNFNSHTIIDVISEKGEQDVYTFTGTAGQRLYFDVLNRGGAYTTIAHLHSPSGTNVFSSWLYDQDAHPITLTETGTYHLVVDGSGEYTDNYTFTFRDVSQATSIVLDTDVTGQLNPGQETQLYQFTGNAGQRIYIDSLMSSPNTRWTLYNSGNQVLDNRGFNDYEISLASDDIYTLAIQGYNGTPVDYKFRIITPETTTTALSLGSNEHPNIISSEISEKGEQDVYTFTGTAGQRLYFDVLNRGGAYTTIAHLHSPSGTNVFSSWLYDQDAHPITLTETGTYHLVVDGSGEYTDNYTFTFRDVSQATSIVLDTDVTGQLNPGQETQLYQFTGNAGQRIYIDSLMSSPNTRWTLYNSGNQVLDNRGFNDYEISLASDDIYTLAIQGYNGTPVDYKFRIITPETTTTALSLGSNEHPNIISSEISEKGEQDVYTFTGTSGQRLYFDSITSSTTGTIYIYSPSGLTYLNHSLTSGDAAPFTLQESGIYRLVVDASGENTGGYSFRVADFSQALSLTLGTAISHSLPSREVRLYKFNGTQGQRLQFDSLLAVSGADWVLYAPGNNVLGSTSASNDFEVVLPSTDTYVLALRSSSASPVNYSFQVNDLTPVAVANAGLGVIYSGTSTATPTTQTFTASAGTFVYFDSQIAYNNPYGVSTKLLDPSSTQVFNINASADAGIYQLQRTGTYSLQVAGNGSYKYTFIDLGAAADLSLNSITNISLNPGLAATAYKFTGTVGQQLFYDGISGSNVSLRMFSPSGRELFNIGAQSDRGLNSGLTFSEAGTYYLLFSNTQATTANVSFRLWDKAVATEINFNTDYTGTLTGGLEANLYRFTGTTGQYLYIDNQAGGHPNQWILYGLGGQNITSAYIYEDRELALSATGEYLLVMQGNGSSNQNYSFHIATPEFTTEALTLNTIVNGNISKRGENDTYTFSGHAGQQLFFDALDGTVTGLTMRLISPSGRAVASWNAQTDRSSANELTLSETGIYQLVIDGNSATTGDYKFRLWDKAAATEINFDTDYTSSLTSSLNADLYRFTGTAGQYLYIDNPPSGSSNRWLLYGTGGQNITSGYMYEDRELALPATGEYLLVMQGNGASNQNYSFHIATPEFTTEA
uniref:Ig-like domain-containing protein n=1 Tax=Nostoc sp. CCY 9925 TaxID=3103865 RepID=UPI0039C6F2A7